MRVSVFMQEHSDLGQAVGEIAALEAAGVRRVWVWNVFGLDAMVLAAVAGGATSRIEIGTAVVPTYPRHPHAMMQEALTVQAACGGRFTLGVGTSHEPVISAMFGIPFERPIRHIREYVTVCRALARGPAAYQGELYNVTAPLLVKGATGGLDVMISALSPQMLRVGGEVSDGVITWLADAAYTRDTAVPAVAEGAARADRPAPPVVTTIPVAVTEDLAAGREVAARELAVYATLPFYRRVLDASGARRPEDVAIVGPEAAVAEAVAEFAAAGTAELAVWPLSVGDDPEASRRRAVECIVGLDA